MADGPLVVTVNGVDKTALILRDPPEGPTVTDTLNQPKRFRFRTGASYQPPATATVVAVRGTLPVFAGTVVSVLQTYLALNPALNNLAWEIECVNYNFLFRRRRPFGVYNASATSVVTSLVSSYSSTFTTTNVQASLANVNIVFDGSKDLAECLTAIALLIGGYWYIDDARDVHFFLVEASATPNPINDSNVAVLTDPPLTIFTDWSQVRTRDYVVGPSTSILAAVVPGIISLPLRDVSIFDLTGTVLVNGQKVTYTGRTQASPPVAPTIVPAAGTGLGSGVYTYAYTDVTAAGETIPSPLATVTLGATPAPTVAPSELAQPGNGVDLGTHSYAYTFVNAGGETLPSPTGNVITATSTPVSNPSNAPTFFNGWVNTGSGGKLVSTGVYKWGYTYVDLVGGETLLSPILGPTTNPGSVGFDFYGFSMTIPGPPPLNTNIKLYRTVANGSTFFATGLVSSTGIANHLDIVPDGSLGAAAPGSNTCNDINRLVVVTNIAIGNAATTARKVYRTAAGGSQLKLLTTIANNSTTFISDTALDATLGANVPVSNTAFSNQAKATVVPVGPSGTTQRKIYRTVVNGSALLLQQTIADNVTTVGVQDSTVDGSLGAAAPTTDTSGLASFGMTTTNGVTAINAVSVTVTAAASLPSSGWVAIGSQTILYTAKTGTTITGVPASGPGSVTASIPTGTTVQGLPTLTGVPPSGAGSILFPIRLGDNVRMFVQVDNAAAQAALALIEDGGASDGIHEGWLDDSTLPNAAAATAAGNADLSLFDTAITTASFVTTADLNIKSGKPISISRTYPPVALVTLTIQSVTITRLFDAAPYGPRFAVKASALKYTLSDLLAQLASARQ